MSKEAKIAAPSAYIQLADRLLRPLEIVDVGEQHVPADDATGRAAKGQPAKQFSQLPDIT